MFIKNGGDTSEEVGSVFYKVFVFIEGKLTYKKKLQFTKNTKFITTYTIYR